jgi:protein-disulfide isomerase
MHAFPGGGIPDRKMRSSRVSNKGWWIGGAIVAVVAIVVALVVVSASGGDSAGDAASGEVSGVETALALTKGIPQAGFTIGKASAPVTVREFIDPQCPVCKTASEDTLPDIVKGPVKDGTAKIVIEPLTFLGPDSSTAALAIAAAAQQDKGFAYSEIMYANQGKENSGWATEELLTGIAQAIPGMDVEAWTTARGSDKAANDLFAVSDRASAAGANSTPTFVITGPGGSTTLVGAQEPAAVIAAIKDVS